MGSDDSASVRVNLSHVVLPFSSLGWLLGRTAACLLACWILPNVSAVVGALVSPCDSISSLDGVKVLRVGVRAGEGTHPIIRNPLNKKSTRHSGPRIAANSFQ